MIENNWAFTDKIKEFSVSELSQKVKEILETTLGQVKVKGEISGLKIASSGHAYFNLKDNLAIVACTCWRPTLAKIEIPLNDGIEIIATGKITSYAGQSRYQLTIEKIEPAGLGAMMQILTERKNKLKAEGLFNPANKKNLPFLPLKIGIITSLTGAVIKDIIHRIQDRCPTQIIIWPVTVQGETAANEVSNAIKGFNALESKFKPDLLIVARGGGSIEDLWPFNEEIVVRSAAASKIPLISAVGHETDYTLIDLAADKRAPTPTAAAEFAVPVVKNLKYTLNMHADRLSSSILALLNYKERTFNNFLRILKHPENYVNLLEQKTDELSFRLLEALPNLLRFKSTRLDKFNIERLNPTKILKFKFLQLSHQKSYLIKFTDKTISNLEQKLKLNRTLLASLDYKNVLKRGFALIQNEQGNLIVSKQKTTNNDKFNIKFYDGEIRVKKL